MSWQASGLRAWLLQRATSVYIAGFLVYLLVHFAVAPPRSYVEWRDWLAQPAVSLATALFFLMLVLHAWVGLRDIVMDYVHPLGLRLAALAGVALALAACGLWALRVLWAGTA